MPSYLFKCKFCDNLERVNINIKDYHKNKNNVECKECNKKMDRCFEKTFSFKIDKSSKEIIEEIKRDKEKILDKFNQGDLRTITDICGDK